jgi:DNA polymerase-3 subunit gamma/tau
MESGGADWPTLIRAMGLTAMTRELANNCMMQSLDETSCLLSLEPRLAHIRSPRAESALEKALQNHFNRPLKLTIRMEAPERETPATQMQRQKEERQRAAEAEIEQDETVIAFKEQFGARLVPGSINPIN